MGAVKNRSVVEILVLSFTFLVIASILGISVTVIIVNVKYPGTDTRGITQGLFGLISATLGALLGLIAGKSASTESLSVRPGDKQPTNLSEPADFWGEATQEHKPPEAPP